jgi:hypothetical protein
MQSNQMSGGNEKCTVYCPVRRILFHQWPSDLPNVENRYALIRDARPINTPQRPKAGNAPGCSTGHVIRLDNLRAFDDSAFR